MTVRLAFAVAAFLEPEILVIDEVLAVGDAEFQKKAIGKMQDISREGGRTVLFVSHNMAAVKSLCTRGIVLENGTVVFAGSSDCAVNYYLNSNYTFSKETIQYRKDRRGTGEIQFKDIEFVNKSNEIIYEVISGDYAKLKIYLDFKKPIVYEELVFGIVIRDLNETKCVDIYSDEMGVKYNISLLEKGSIEVVFSELMLRGGSYYLDVVVQSYNLIVTQIDLVHRAFEFNVFEGDVWKTKKTNRATNVPIINAKFV
jgi:lipopolysaccharide transport system ATP-binding protein